jgi:hypothetical protein
MSNRIRTSLIAGAAVIGAGSIALTPYSPAPSAPTLASPPVLHQQLLAPPVVQGQQIKLVSLQSTISDIRNVVVSHVQQQENLVQTIRTQNKLFAVAVEKVIKAPVGKKDEALVDLGKQVQIGSQKVLAAADSHKLIRNALVAIPGNVIRGVQAAQVQIHNGAVKALGDLTDGNPKTTIFTAANDYNTGLKNGAKTLQARVDASLKNLRNAIVKTHTPKVKI